MNLKALYKLSYGLYVICSKKGDKFNGQIANTVFQVCAEPPTIAVAINRQNLTNSFISESKAFTVSILSRDTPLSFIGNFGFKSGRDVDKLRGINYRLGVTGAPIVLDNILAYLEARVIAQLEVSTHTIFIAEIAAADVVKEGEPMTYAYYHQVKRGTTPKAAPGYIEEAKEGVPRVAKYRCTVCSYVYDPDKGDPESGIKPGTPFERLPDDWVCPICGASKEQFERVEEAQF